MSPSNAFLQSLFPLSEKTLLDSLIASISALLSFNSDSKDLITVSKSSCLLRTLSSTSEISFSAPVITDVTTVFCSSCFASSAAFTSASSTDFSSASAASFAFCSACCIAILAAVSSATCFANASRSKPSGVVLLSSDIFFSKIEDFSSLGCSISTASAESIELAFTKFFLNSS